MRFKIASVERRLRDSPGHIALVAIFDLAAHDLLVRLAQHAAAGERMTSAGIRYSNIDPDQEMSAEPRPTGVKSAAQTKPVRRRNISFCDRDEAREARLGSQQVVAIGSKAAVRDAISDGKELSRVVEQESEIHRQKHRHRPFAPSGQAVEPGPRNRPRNGRSLGQRVDSRQQIGDLLMIHEAIVRE